jgi:hypothetical protein
MKPLLVLMLCAVASHAGSTEDRTLVPRQVPTSKIQLTNADATAIPRMLSYQGKLTDTLGLPVADTTYSVEFRLYVVPSGGSPFWNETQNVQTRSGLFSVLLGSVTPIGSMPDAGTAYLGMSVNSGTELSPRLRMVSAAYAYKADTANYAGSAPPSGVAGGDLAGSYPSPTVDGLQGRAVAATAPSTNQVLKWTGSQWAPRNDSVGSGGGSGVTSVSQSTGIICTPNPITTTGTVAFDQTYGDGRYVNTTGDSVSGVLRVGSQLRVHDKASLGYSCYNNGHAAFCAGYGNSAGGDRASITGGEDNSAGGKYSHISGGSENQASALWATIGGGNVNEATDTAATVAGGQDNFASAAYATVGGGSGNSAVDRYTTVGGGYDNTADTNYATAAGGRENNARGRYAVVAGGDRSLAGAYCAVGGGGYNEATTRYATVAGGYSNLATDEWSSIGGGENNAASGRYATISGGYENTASAAEATVGGGDENTASGRHSVVGGGDYNTASEDWATVGGGRSNVASASYATVGGGDNNDASGSYAAIPGGRRCAARRYSSLASGVYARANNAGSFVWSDSVASASDSVYTTGSNQFRVRARGGTWFFSNLGMTTGAYLAPNSNSWESACDSATKEDFRPVDKKVLLDKVVALRVRDYKMKDQNDGARHIGPVAQDFHNAFGYGGTETGINLADADGVALAAIQALYERVEAQQAEIEALKAELKRR